jgi:hypothetical protein
MASNNKPWTYVLIAAGVLAICAFAGVRYAGTAHWSVPHHRGPGFSAARPECPATWDSLPMWNDKMDARGSGTNGVTPKYVVVPKTGLAVPGPHTDIPEFHDCQRFILGDETDRKYGALFAIFSAFNLDSVITLLGSEPVTWSSTNPSVVSVLSPGLISGISAGTATIRATSTVDASRIAQVQIVVLPALAASGNIGTLSISGSAPDAPPLRVGQQMTLTAAVGPQTTSILAAAEIYTFGPGYDDLGIGPNFTCLYVYYGAAGDLKAKTVPAADLGPGEQACVGAANPNTTDGRELSIVQNVQSAVASDYPAVARWGYNRERGRQYMGLKCGMAWCWIGAAASGFVPAPPATPIPMSVTGEQRVMRIPGWHDSQELAYERAAGGVIPSGIIGTVYPSPDLEQKTADDFKHFVETGYVALDVRNAITGAADYYRSKFNFDPVDVSQPLSAMNKISLCWGSRTSCGVPEAPTGKGCGPDRVLGLPIKRWWVKLERAGGTGEPMYRCVKRRGHDNGGSIVATARWRWLAVDETIWEYCMSSGCCETQGDPTSPGWP